MNSDRVCPICLTLMAACGTISGAPLWRCSRCGQERAWSIEKPTRQEEHDAAHEIERCSQHPNETLELACPACLLSQGIDNQLLVDVAQLLDGWHQDGTAWTEWDESVRKRVSLTLESGAREPREEPWQPIETPRPDKDGVFFWWVVALPSEESYRDTSGKPITADHKPYLHKGKFGTWGSCSKATHWMPLPAPPVATLKGEK